jgi:dihydrofolate reductase
MRRIRYTVAMNLDGYIAGRNGEADWIVIDPEIDFQAIFQEFDTVFVGRRTFEAMARTGRATMPGMKLFVFSRTLRQSDYPGVTIVSENLDRTIHGLRAKPGKHIWLFGGSSLFGSLADAKLVDTVEVAVMPVILGAGIPLAPCANRLNLKLTDHKVYKTGGVQLRYAVG